MSLPKNAQKRKSIPVATGFVDYFPDAMVAVAQLSKIGNDQHNPGAELHWDRSKSSDESDALMRHFLERGTFDYDGVRHSAKVAWRAMAMLQKELEDAEVQHEIDTLLDDPHNELGDGNKVQSYLADSASYWGVSKEDMTGPLKWNPLSEEWEEFK